MIATNYSAEITLTSGDTETLLDWTGFSVKSRYGVAEKEFSVDLRRPINIDIGDKVSISDGFNGALVPLITNKEIEGDSGSVNQTHLSGLGSMISRRGPIKHMVFVNQSWLKQRCPSYHLRNVGAGWPAQIIMQYNVGSTLVQYEGVSRARLFLAELPGKNVRDNEFGCVVSSGITRQDIASRLASLCGYQLVTNMPRLPIQKTYTIYSTQTYWQSLMQLFADWKPMIFISGNKIYIMDVGHDQQNKIAGDQIALSEDSFTLLNWNIQRNQRPIDHILITGPDTQYTYTARSQLVSKRTYSEVTLPGADIVLQFEEKEENEAEDALAKTLYSQGVPGRVVRTLRTITQRQDPFNPENSATTKEVIEQYDSNDTKISESTTEYKYAGFNKPVQSVTTEYGLIGKVAGGNDDTYNDVKQSLPKTWEWTKLSETTMRYRDYYEDIKQVETDLEQWCLCIAYKDKERKDGKDYDFYDQVMPLWQALQSNINVFEENDKNGLGYMTAWQLYKHETVRFDKASPIMYRKTRTQTVYYPFRVQKQAYEDIPLPSSRHNSVIHRKWEYFWQTNSLLYYQGGAFPVPLDPQGWHPRVDISNLDITTETEARKIAYRQFASNPLVQTTAVIETTLPLYNVHVGGVLNLPECVKPVLTYDTDGTILGYQDVTIPAQSYWIIGHERVVQFEGDVGEAQRTFKVYDRIELQDFF